MLICPNKRIPATLESDSSPESSTKCGRIPEEEEEDYTTNLLYFRVTVDVTFGRNILEQRQVLNLSEWRAN